MVSHGAWLLAASLLTRSVAVDEAGFEYYDGSAGPRSLEFSVQLRYKEQTVSPHVYGISVPEDRQHGPEPNDRSISWVEFAQPCGGQSVSTVEVTRKTKPFPRNVHIRPRRYGIPLQLSADAHTVTFDVPGCGKHLSVHYGTVFESNSDKSSKYSSDSSSHDAMLVFVSEPTPTVPADALVITPGEHYLDQGGVLNVSCQYPAVHVQRGAYVYGKLAVRCDTRPTDVFGTGILDGRFFRYLERHGSLWNETQMMLNFEGSAGGNVWGLTAVNPNFRLYDVVRSGFELAQFRGLGWAANNGGGHFEFNSSARDSFLRSTDDLIKVRGGSIRTENMVLWQSYNGGTFQFGWMGLSLQNISHLEASVIEGEWRAPTVWEGYATRPNNAVVSCVDTDPTDPAQMMGPFTWRDLQIDGDVAHPLSLHLENGFLGNLIFDGLTIAGKITGFSFATAAQDAASIANVTFRNFTISGQPVRGLDDPSLRFHSLGGVQLDTFKFEPAVVDAARLVI